MKIEKLHYSTKKINLEYAKIYSSASNIYSIFYLSTTISLLAYIFLEFMIGISFLMSKPDLSPTWFISSLINFFILFFFSISNLWNKHAIKHFFQSLILVGINIIGAYQILLFYNEDNYGFITFPYYFIVLICTFFLAIISHFQAEKGRTWLGVTRDF